MNLATDEGRALLVRMERVERRSRWLTALAVVVALLCVAILAWQFAPLDSQVEARGFVLRDAKWHVRGELKVRNDGTPVLRLNNRGGQPAAVLTVRDDGAVALRLYDTAEQERAGVRLDEHGTPLFSLTGANGRPRVVLTAEETTEAGEQRIVMRDRLGRMVWSAPAVEEAGK
jgi:hypothetical protein